LVIPKVLPMSRYSCYLCLQSVQRSKESERLPGRTRLARPKKEQHRSTEEKTKAKPERVFSKSHRKALHSPPIIQFSSIKMQKKSFSL
jgi:hypothetical protein